MDSFMDKWTKPVSALALILLTRHVQFKLAQLLIVFTPRNSLLRTASIPIQVALGTLVFPLVQDAIVAPISIHYRCLAGGTVALQTILSISFCSMIRLDDRDAIALSGSNAPLATKLSALTALMNNQRCLGTHLQIKWIPPFDERRPAYIPSRGAALRSTALGMGMEYLLRQILITLLWQRIPNGLFWCLYIASWLKGIYLFGDLVGLLAGDPVEAHPPAFGSLRHTRTIRGFWGKYWHQSNRVPFQGMADCLCKGVLGLTGLVQRYANILFVFALSGVFHVVTDLAEGVEVGQSRAMRFFCAQALGIALEDGVQALWRACYGYTRETVVAVPLWARALGYLWTWSFLSVTAGWFVEPHLPMFLDKHGTPFGFIYRSSI